VVKTDALFRLVFYSASKGHFRKLFRVDRSKFEKLKNLFLTRARPVSSRRRGGAQVKLELQLAITLFRLGPYENACSVDAVSAGGLEPAGISSAMTKERAVDAKTRKGREGRRGGRGRGGEERWRKLPRPAGDCALKPKSAQRWGRACEPGRMVARAVLSGAARVCVLSRTRACTRAGATQMRARMGHTLWRTVRTTNKKQILEAAARSGVQ